MACLGTQRRLGCVLGHHQGLRQRDFSGPFATRFGMFRETTADEHGEVLEEARCGMGIESRDALDALPVECQEGGVLQRNGCGQPRPSASR